MASIQTLVQCEKSLYVNKAFFIKFLESSLIQFGYVTAWDLLVSGFSSHYCTLVSRASCMIKCMDCTVQELYSYCIYLVSYRKQWPASALLIMAYRLFR